MSWYEEAAKEIVENIAPNASTGHESDCSCDDCRMLKVGRIENARQIIAKHDPNRWIPVSEGIPEIGMFVEAVTDVGFVFYGSVFRPDLWVEVNGLSHDGVTHWRRRVRPEVKE